MSTHEDFPDGAYSVCAEEQLEELTSAGSRLVRIMDSIDGIRFLLQRGRDSAHEELRGVVELRDAEMRAATAEQRSLRETIRAMTTLRDKWRDDCAALQQSRKDQDERIRALEGMCSESGHRVSQLRRELQAARRHFGAKAWSDFQTERTEKGDGT